MRLDQPNAVTKGGNSGAVIVPGKSAESLLIHLVASLKPNEVMPPGDAKKLTKEQVALLRAWVDQGAKWGIVAAENTVGVKSSHWAFQAPVRPAVPKPALPATNAIDAVPANASITTSISRVIKPWDNNDELTQHPFET